MNYLKKKKKQHLLQEASPDWALPEAQVASLTSVYLSYLSHNWQLQ